VIDTYLARRIPNERFRDTYRRLGATFFKEVAYAAA
jgi:sulfite reductase (NADPH) hemoprotein beta-component